ncbi:MAG: HDOD domain-containing protein [Deltaproteobacteria bacterium]|nr:HDOD domain-containing protein [Deltaproteobacteria bacterium]
MNDILQKRILFVDDEPMVLKGLQRILRKMRNEWEMTFASSGKEALDILDKTSMDVIVSDLKMPDMDGTQLLTQVKKHHPQLVRIILSGHLEHEMTLKSVQIAHQSLSKPCDAEILKHTLAKIFALRDILSDVSIKKIVSQIESLPSMPAIYIKIVDEMQSPDPSLKRVGEIISQDVSMTAKILQVVNSSFFGLPRKISSSHEAVVLLGMETIKSLVLSVKIFSEFSQRNFSWFSIDDLFNHSMSVSMYAKAIAKNATLDNNLLNNALMAGLLHDLGKLILATNLSKSYNQVVTEAQGSGRHLWELEYETYGTSHAEIGAYLMGLWSLENPIIEAIAFHHCPAKSMNPNMGLLTAVHFGNAADHDVSSATDQHTDLHLDTSYLNNLGVINQISEWRQVCEELTERNQ